jgi:hypothetical protein
MNQDMKIIREINLEAERFYDEAQSLGNHAYQAFKDKSRTQLTGLENVAESSLKTSDIIDYIKKKIARSDPGNEWRAKGKEDPPTEESQKGFGERLKSELEALSDQVERVCRNVEIVTKVEKGRPGQDEKLQRARMKADRWKRQDIHLRLMREFIRQMVVQYEYRAGEGGE